MNLDAIKRCCADTKWAEVVTDRNGDQWISNNCAMYRVEGVRVDSAGVRELLDLTDKQRGEWCFDDKHTDDWRVNASAIEDDIELREIGRVMLCEETLLVLGGAAGLLMINQKFLKPIRADYRRYFLRIDEEHNPMVAVFGDMWCSALIMPISAFGQRQIRELAETIAGGSWVRQIWDDDAANAEAEAERVAAGMGITTTDGGGDNA